LQVEGPSRAQSRRVRPSGPGARSAELQRAQALVTPELERRAEIYRT
jgi:hypothetical protein